MKHIILFYSKHQLKFYQLDIFHERIHIHEINIIFLLIATSSYLRRWRRRRCGSAPG